MKKLLLCLVCLIVPALIVRASPIEYCIYGSIGLNDSFFPDMSYFAECNPGQHFGCSPTYLATTVYIFSGNCDHPWTVYVDFCEDMPQTGCNKTTTKDFDNLSDLGLPDGLYMVEYFLFYGTCESGNGLTPYIQYLQQVFSAANGGQVILVENYPCDP